LQRSWPSRVDENHEGVADRSRSLSHDGRHAAAFGRAFVTGIGASLAVIHFVLAALSAARLADHGTDAAYFRREL